MKRIEFKTEKSTIKAIELPVDDAELLGRMDDSYWSYQSKKIAWDKFEMKGKWELIGRLPDITEEQAKEVVDEFKKGYLGLYRDYLVQKSSFRTALESLLSLLEADGVVFENPLGSEPLTYIDIFSGEKKLRLDWLNMNDKVWNKQQTYLFKKVS